MSKKGFHDILTRIEEVGNMHYNDVLRYAFDRKIVRSRASITIILNGLTSMELLERTVIDSRPVRTSYKVSRKGKNILHYIKEIEDEISS
jgi:DNA-binding HxlR family transcriptional regulator